MVESSYVIISNKKNLVNQDSFVNQYPFVNQDPVVNQDPFVNQDLFVTPDPFVNQDPFGNQVRKSTKLCTADSAVHTLKSWISDGASKSVGPHFWGALISDGAFLASAQAP